MADLFGRLQSPRKRVMSARHLQILNLLLDTGEISLADISGKTRQFYSVKNPSKALVRDLSYLVQLGALGAKKLPEENGFLFSINLDWPTQITETEFFKRV